MIYKEYEDSIIERLNTLVDSGIEVEVIPEVEGDFKKPFVKPRITVMYKSSDFALPQSTSETSQLETLQFQISLEARKLRGALGIYDLYKLVRAKLLGFKPAHGGRMYQVKSGYVDYKEGIWVHNMEWATQSLAVMLPDEEVEMLITRIKIESEFGESIISSQQ